MNKMTGRDMIKWIQENQAEDLPFLIRRPGQKDEETIKEEDLEIKMSVVEGSNGQGQYKKYFII